MSFRARLLGYSAILAPALWGLFRSPTKARFEELAQKWEDIVGPAHTSALSDVLQALIQTPLPDGCVVDVGCGTGLGTRLIERCLPERAILGLDIVEKMVRIASSRPASRTREDPSRKRTFYVVGDAAKPPVRKGTAALVVCMNAPIFLREIVSLLVPGGVLVAVWSEGSQTPIWVDPRVLRWACRKAGLCDFRTDSRRPPRWAMARRGS